MVERPGCGAQDVAAVEVLGAVQLFLRDTAGRLLADGKRAPPDRALRLPRSTARCIRAAHRVAAAPLAPVQHRRHDSQFDRLVARLQRRSLAISVRREGRRLPIAHDTMQRNNKVLLYKQPL